MFNSVIIILISLPFGQQSFSSFSSVLSHFECTKSSPNSDVILAVHADLSDLTKNGMLFIHVDIVQFAIDAEITF